MTEEQKSPDPEANEAETPQEPGGDTGAEAAAEAEPSQAAEPAGPGADAAAMAEQMLDEVGDAVGRAAGSEPSAPTPPPDGSTPLPLPSLEQGARAKNSSQLDLLSDVNLDVKIELGRTRMLVEDVLQLCDGAVVELDKLAGDPVDIYVNERHVARGEVLVLNDTFCVRINEIVEPEDRMAG